VDPQVERLVVEKFEEGILATGLEGISTSVVLSDSNYHNRFYFARGKREDGSSGPEKSFKNFGGGLSSHEIIRCADKDSEFLEAILDGSLNLNDPITLARVGAKSEIEAETNFRIPLRRLEELFLMMIRHVDDWDTDRKAQGKIHQDWSFGITLAFSEVLSVDQIEIYEGGIALISDVERGIVRSRNREVTISPHHIDPAVLFYKKVHNGEGEFPVIRCDVRKSSCPICGAKKRASANPLPTRLTTDRATRILPTPVVSDMNDTASQLQESLRSIEERLKLRRKV